MKQRAHTVSATNQSSRVPARALPTQDAARYLGVSPGFLRRARMAGSATPSPRFVKLSPRLIVYRIEDLDAHLESLARAKGQRIEDDDAVLSAGDGR